MPTGIIIRTTGSQYSVATSDKKVHTCCIRGNFRLQGIRSTNPIAVGDHVDFEYPRSGEIGFITRIHDRKNYFIRKATNLSKQTHVIAANIDHAFIIATIGFPRTSTGFIDRCLVTAEAYHIPISIVWNKTDLYANDKELWEYHNYLNNLYESIGYECLEVSALKGTNVDKLKNLLADKVSLFLGHSGVGKSALIHAIDPNLNPKTGEISHKHLKGTHTTTFAEMYPLAFGGYLIDTPGIKEFGMVNFNREEVSLYYPEIRKFGTDCRYYNCTHEHEPGCAVKAAVENELINPERYQNYLNIMNGREMSVESWKNK